MRLKVFLLGGVAAEANGRGLDEARFPGGQGRLLFAYLVAARSRPVPRDELADAIWGESPPATWEEAVTVIASKLRGQVAEDGITLTNAPPAWSPRLAARRAGVPGPISESAAIDESPR